MGGNLVVIGVTLFVVVASGIAMPQFGPFEAVILLLFAAVCTFIVYIGYVHLKRAFGGRRR